MKFTPLIYPFLLALVLVAAPAASFAGVKIGAGDVKLFTPPENTTATQADQPNTPPPPENKPQKASPLARSTAELFRREIVELKEALIKKSLRNAPKSRRDDFRQKLGREIKIEKILNLYALTLEKYYTEDELKALRTFMAEDTNRQMLEKLPAVLSQMGLDRQDYLNMVLENFLRRELFEKLEKGEPTILTPQ